VNGRTHIVGLGDVSASGAYLIARVAVQVGDEHLLRVLVVPALHELTLRARVVRIVEDGASESAHHPRGIAVSFVDVDADTRARLESFVKAGEPLRG
jgi:Tfp pilus assembly protein PilZ